MKQALFLLALLAFHSSLSAEVSLSPLFQDHAVLQREIKVPIWGKADPGEQITVEFAGQTKSATADKTGKWRVTLDPMAGDATPQKLTISSNKKATPLVFHDILVGEVWLCSGQSNMAWTVRENGVSVQNAEAEQAGAIFPLIRHIRIPKANVKEPSQSFVGEWKVCSPETVGSFSGVAYFFGRDLFKKLNVPIGLINSSYGGTPIEAWLSKNTIETEEACRPAKLRMDQVAADWTNIVSRYRVEKEAWTKEAETAKSAGTPFHKPQPRQPVGPGHPYSPFTVYNAMLHPILGAAIRGVIWYQGEGNSSRSEEYQGLLAALIRQWRQEWNQGDFAFYFVQLPNFKGYEPEEQDWPWLREAQAKTRSVRNTGMIVSIDIGNPEDPHPRNKQDIGKRLSLLALNQTYGFTDLEYSGPTYERCEISRPAIRLHFKNAKGMRAKGVPITGFEIAGEDRKFAPASAVIEGETILVSSPQIQAPAAVRYAWVNAPEASLFNASGLPAAPFRTDSWERRE